MSSGLISVVVSTYNREDALDAVLRALAGQTDRGFEIIVADDGSGPATKAVVEGWRERAGVPLTHAWQADSGFRLAEARNRAIRRARGEIVVFLDGDCLARPGFVAAHRRLAQRGWFVAGNRLLLSEAATRRVLATGEAIERASLVALARARIGGEINRLLPLMTLPDVGWRRATPAAWAKARGCNLAMWRDDLVAVDGFDAAFAGWGLEDTDIAVRLMRGGVKLKDGRFATGVLHLWHREADRSGLAENQRRLDETIRATHVRARRGLSGLDAIETVA